MLWCEGYRDDGHLNGGSVDGAAAVADAAAAAAGDAAVYPASHLAVAGFPGGISAPYQTLQILDIYFCLISKKKKKRCILLFRCLINSSLGWRALGQSLVLRFLKLLISIHL